MLFAQLLGSSTERRTIRHLFLSIQIPGAKDDPTHEGRAELLSAFETVLCYTATMLKSLVVYEPTDLCLVCTTQQNFPVLSDLSIPEAITALPLHVSKEHNACFPSLHRLHISRCNQFTFHLPLWASLAETAPQLTHLRISGVRDDPQLPRFLRVLLRVPAPERTSAQGRRRRASTIGTGRARARRTRRRTSWRGYPRSGACTCSERRSASTHQSKSFVRSSRGA
jgi:hypothetical protein